MPWNIIDVIFFFQRIFSQEYKRVSLQHVFAVIAVIHLYYHPQLGFEINCGSDNKCVDNLKVDFNFTRWDTEMNPELCVCVSFVLFLQAQRVHVSVLRLQIQWWNRKIDRIYICLFFIWVCSVVHWNADLIWMIWSNTGLSNIRISSYHDNAHTKIVYVTPESLCRAYMWLLQTSSSTFTFLFVFYHLPVLPRLKWALMNCWTWRYRWRTKVKTPTTAALFWHTQPDSLTGSS